MRGLALLILMTAALFPLTWVGVQALFWWGRGRGGDDLVDAAQPYGTIVAGALALALAGVVAVLFF